MPRLPFVNKFAPVVWLFWSALSWTAPACAADGTAPVSVESLLRALRETGVDVIYSSALVTPAMNVPGREGSALEQATAALAAHGLELRRLGPNTYVVAQAVVARPPEQDAPPAEPMQEVSVYASRYAIEGQDVAEQRRLSSTDIDFVPGSHDDSLRALRSLPGLATNASGRPYIRGSLSQDVLVRYDGITLLDPFHFKNFQSLISAIDPATISSIEVFSGGFPVRYGTRSGGVIDVSAPSIESGYENRVSLSLISGGVSSIGRSEHWPMEWTTAIRRSTLDLLEPVTESLGSPQFSDSLGRLRWHTDNGSWTAGWLLLDDRIRLGNDDDEEQAAASYREEYLWLARDHRFGDALSTRFTAVVTHADWHRNGTLEIPGVVSGSVDETTDFERVEFTNTWTYAPSARSSYSFGAEAAVSDAEKDYLRHASYQPGVADAFGRPQQDDLVFSAKPSVFTYAVHAARRHRWADFEAELGLRFDGQRYDPGGIHSQLSPRLNLRYDRNDRLRYYASLGRFTQAQHVEEWRAEEAQPTAQSAQVATHGILGLSYDSAAGTRWSIEAYTKQWTTVEPYFDNRLDPLALSPDLAPDRVRLQPAKSEASGLEISARKALSERLTTWGTLAWSRVADDFAHGDVLRSWDQPLAATLGAAWTGGRYDVSVLGGWHRGWPRTAFDPDTLQLGGRNGARWSDFYSLDLRGNYRWRIGRGDLITTLEVTNATNRDNACCLVLEHRDGALTTDTDDWLPVIVNLGFTYRWRGGD